MPLGFEKPAHKALNPLDPELKTVYPTNPKQKTLNPNPINPETLQTLQTRYIINK